LNGFPAWPRFIIAAKGFNWHCYTTSELLQSTVPDRAGKSLNAASNSLEKKEEGTKHQWVTASQVFAIFYMRYSPGA
jgi:hypothetical protein